MPEWPKPRRDPNEIVNPDDLWEIFAEPAAWKRSKRGNLWRNYQGKTVTIFGRDDGYFAWSISDKDGTRFSRGGYEDEDEAMGALAAALPLD
jgi:hypothetical protein